MSYRLWIALFGALTKKKERTQLNDSTEPNYFTYVRSISAQLYNILANKDVYFPKAILVASRMVVLHVRPALNLEYFLHVRKKCEKRWLASNAKIPNNMQNQGKSVGSIFSFVFFTPIIPMSNSSPSCHSSLPPSKTYICLLLPVPQGVI